MNENSGRKIDSITNHSVDYYQELFIDAPIAMASALLTGKLIEVNPLFCQFFGYDKQVLLKKGFLELTYKEDRERSLSNLKDLVENKISIIDMEKRYINNNGNIIWGKVTANLIKDIKGNPKRVVLTLVDITKQKNTETELRNSVDYLFEKSHLMKTLMDNTQDIVYMKDTEGKYLFFNKSAEKFTGKKALDIIGKGVDEVYPAHVAQKLTSRDKEIYEDEQTFTTEERVLDINGKSNIFLSTKGPIFDENHDMLGMYGVSRNITDRIKSQIELRESEKKYRWITENVADVISVYNINNREHTFVSPSIMSLLGLSKEEGIKLKFEDTIVPEAIEEVTKLLTVELNKFISMPDPKNNFTHEVQMIRKNGSKVWTEISFKFQYNELKEIESVNIIRNIEERKKSEEVMHKLSYYDQLTGVYNRRFYEEELKRLDNRRNLPLSIIMADINGLKLANDAFGHQEGDLILKKIGKILKSQCRADEIISRIGGDEFIILMPKTDGESAHRLVERINKAVTSERMNHGILSLSIGYAVKEKPSEQMHQIFKRAEDDMYSHKLAESSSMRSKTIDLIMNSLFEKSNREMLHSDRVSMLCHNIASEMEFSQEDINQAKIAGLVHDIGKIGVNNTILDKPGKLDQGEWLEIQKHCEIGYRILSSVNEFSEIAEFVLSHQERWDGKGYPQGLKGENIPLQARIIAVADSFDAMTSDRSYRKGMSNSEAVIEIRKCSGTQFDPEIAKIFIEKVVPKMQAK